MLLGRFARARWGYRFGTRARFERWQTRRLRRHLRRLARVPFYADHRPARSLAQLPVIDKGTLLAHFDELNTRGVRLTEALAVAQEAERSRDFAPLVDGDLTVGLSSGTSGRRGAFLISPRERMLWAGTVLARVLDREAVRALLRPGADPVRIAFFLRAGGHLYESVGSRRVEFAYFDLTLPFEQLADELDRAVAVDVLVAPASVLDALARRALDGALRMRPRIVLAVAEVLDPPTAERVQDAWGVSARQVYQATEGLLALSCAHGALHLNEESVHIEREWLDAAHTRFVPIVTDFERRTQLITRYRLDDVLRVDAAAPERCTCGRVTAVIAAIDGRTDEVLHLPGAAGAAEVELFPDVLRHAMAAGSAHYADWRVRQAGVGLVIALDDPTPDVAAAEQAVREHLAALLDGLGARAAVSFEPWVAPDPTAKRRRILREPA